MPVKRLVRISKLDSLPDFHIRSSTAYKWIHLGRFPEIFVRIGGCRFLDLDAFELMIEESRGKKTSRSNSHKNRQ
jgi:hypothetical protein